MQVVGEGSREEFDAGPVERSSHPTVVPTHVEGHLTERIPDSQARGLIVNEGVESQPFGGYRCIGDHPVARPIGPIGNGSQVNVGMPPQSPRLGFQSLVHQAPSNLRRGPVQPRHHEDAIRGVNLGRISGTDYRVGGSGNRVVKTQPRQQSQLIVHRGVIAQKLGRDAPCFTAHRRVVRNVPRHPIAQKQVANLRADETQAIPGRCLATLRRQTGIGHPLRQSFFHEMPADRFLDP